MHDCPKCFSDCDCEAGVLRCTHLCLQLADDGPSAFCGRCGRTLRVEETAEAGLIAAGAMVEFYHCADRETCEAAFAKRKRR